MKNSASASRALARRHCQRNQERAEPAHRAALTLAQTVVYVAKSRERCLRGLARCKKILHLCNGERLCGAP